MNKKDTTRTMQLSKEEDYFRKREMEAIEMLRKENARKADLAAMGEVIDSQNPKILAKLEALGFNSETVRLLYLLPLVQTAWADNRVDAREMAMILDLSRERGITSGGPSEQALTRWLRSRPTNEFFQGALELISELLCSRPPEVRREKALEIVELCARVAAVSGGLFGLGERTSGEEGRVIKKVRERTLVPKESTGSPLDCDDDCIRHS
jgi:hypothetical protein